MLGILKNNIPKDIYKNRVTYLLMTLLIGVGMYIASTLASMTYSDNIVCEANFITSNYQDGQFSLRKPLTEEEELSLEKLGYTLERIFSFDLEQENGSILRFFKVRKKIDLLVLDDGKYPELSGGQQQRVSIARALIKNSPILLCDEPTGALDSVTSKEILKLLESINKKYGTTIIMVTHNTAIPKMMDTTMVMRDGMIREIKKNPNPVSAEELNDL